MLPSTFELIEAKETVADLLEQLEIEAYLFDFEPREAVWEVCIECAAEEGWQSVRIPVERTLLVKARSDHAVREALLREWQKRLCGCRRNGGGRASS